MKSHMRFQEVKDYHISNNIIFFNYLTIDTSTMFMSEVLKSVLLEKKI